MAEDIHQRIAHLNQQVVRLYQEGYYEQAVERIRDAYRTNYIPAVFPALDALVYACIQKEDYAGAEPLISQSIQIQRQIFGEEAPFILEPLITKALIAKKLGKREITREIFEQVLQTRRRIWPKDHPDVRKSLDDLAHFYYEYGDFDQAEPLLQESIDIHQRVSNGEDQGLARNLTMLGEIYSARGELSQARPLLEKALDIQRKQWGEYHPELANLLAQLSTLYFNTQNYPDAEWINTYFLELVRRIVGEQHPLYATTLERMAQLQNAMCQYTQAEALYSQALQIRSESQGKDTPEVANTLFRLANLYQDTGKYNQAEPLYQQALAIQQNIPSDKHVPLAHTLNALGVLYMSMGKLTAAEPLLLRSRNLERKHYGDKALEVTPISNNLASLYRDKGDYDKAEKLFLEILTIQHEHYGEAHLATADTLSNLAILYQSKNRYEEAKKLVQQSLDIQRTALGEEHPHVASTALRLAQLYSDMQRYDMAEQHFLEALHIREKVFGDVNPLVAEVLFFLALLYHKMNKYDDAETMARQLISISNETWGKQDAKNILTLQLLADLCERKGDTANAIIFYKQVLSIQRQISSTDHSHTVNTLHSLATIYSEIGEYAQAQQLFQEAIDVQSQATSDQDPSLVLHLLGLGQLYTAMNNNKKAIAVFERAFEILSTVSENRLEVAETLSSLGYVYHNSGDLWSAERFYLHALKIRRRVTPEDQWSHVPLLTSLGALYEMRGEFEEARSYLNQALDIGQKSHQKNSPTYATILNNMAMLEHAQGNYAEAVDNLKQALTIFETNHYIPDTCKVLYNLAEMYAAMDQVNDALGHIKRATTLENHIMGQIFSIGTEEQRMTHLKMARSRMSQFLSLIVSSFMHSQQEIYTALSFVLQRKALSADALAMQREAILQGKYRHLQPQLQQLATIRSQLARKILAGPDQEERKVYQQGLEEDAVRISQLEADLARQIPEMNLEQKLQSTNHREVAMAIPDGVVLIEFVRFSFFDFKAIRSQGGSYWKADRYLAFVQPAREPENLQMFDLGDADSIDHMISNWRTSISHDEDDRYEFEETQTDQVQSPEMNAGTVLRAAILEPLLSAVKDCKRLLIAPDGDLTRVPFEVLPHHNDRYLIDDYQISYLSTGRDLLRGAPADISQATPPIVIADPDFDLEVTGANAPAADEEDNQQLLETLKQCGIYFSRLPGTRREGENIARLLGTQPLSGKSALKSALKTRHSPRILHLATHGFFLKYQKQTILKPEDFSVGMTVRSADTHHRPIVLNGILANATEFIDTAYEDEFSRLSGQGLENPMLRSGLALAGANTWLQGKPLPAEAEDAIFTAEDVSGMDLLATDLVVLSACETGLGEIQIGEGVFGLRRAFVLAGAKTLIMSLWRIPDRQTQELMITFYQNILSGQSYIDALRTAQLAMRAKYQDPFYWGAFICQGFPGLRFQP